MKYSRGQFTNEYYQLWEMGLLLPTPASVSLYSVKYRKNHFDEYSRVTLKAVSATDALERACYAITYASPWRPEDIDLHAVYDEEENLLWIDEPYYDLVQKKNEFRGMERREFLARFGVTSAAILFGLRPVAAKAGTTITTLSGAASGFSSLTGEQLYATAGSFSWTAPSGVTSVCVVCVGGGGGGSTYPGNGGAGGGLGWKNNISVTAGNSYSLAVGGGGTAAIAKIGGNSSNLANNGGTGNEGGKGGDSFFVNNTTVCGFGGDGGKSGNVSITYMYGGNFVGGGGGKGGDNKVTSTNGDAGGAGGYAGQGGTRDDSSGSVRIAPSGGGGGLGIYPGSDQGYGGGGVGLYGQGSDGMNGNTAGNTNSFGTGGSGGTNGGAGQSYKPDGGMYGGAGGWNAGPGGSGAVRIIWGVARSFPSNAT